MTIFASEVFNFRLFLGLITFIISILILENYNFKFYSNKLIFTTCSHSYSAMVVRSFFNNSRN